MEVVRETVRSITLGPAVTHRNLTVFPLLGTSQRERTYRTLDEALEAGTARVSEVSSAGRVPELSVVNEGSAPVLLLDGEELKGAKQNRVLNLTVLVAAGKTLVIPVSCVEAGRWRGPSIAFERSANVLFSAARASKTRQVSASIAGGRGYRSDQAAIWSAIDEKLAALGTKSPTGAMEAAYRQRSREIEDYVAALRPSEGQAGAIFAVDGRVVGCELFDHPETLAGLMAKLVRSYALDAIETAGAESHAAAADAARTFLGEVADARMEVFPALGLGEDVRISGTHLVGAALVAEDRVMHLSAFRLADDRNDTGWDENGPRMVSSRIRLRLTRDRRGPGGSEVA